MPYSWSTGYTAPKTQVPGASVGPPSTPPAAAPAAPKSTGSNWGGLSGLLSGLRGGSSGGSSGGMGGLSGIASLFGGGGGNQNRDPSTPQVGATGVPPGQTGGGGGGFKSFDMGGMIEGIRDAGGIRQFFPSSADFASGNFGGGGLPGATGAAPPVTPPVTPPAGTGGGLGQFGQMPIASLPPGLQNMINQRWATIGGGQPMPTNMGDFLGAAKTYYAANPPIQNRNRMAGFLDR